MDRGGGCATLQVYLTSLNCILKKWWKGYTLCYYILTTMKNSFFKKLWGGCCRAPIEKGWGPHGGRTGEIGERNSWVTQGSNPEAFVSTWVLSWAHMLWFYSKIACICYTTSINYLIHLWYRAWANVWHIVNVCKDLLCNECACP